MRLWLSSICLLLVSVSPSGAATYLVNPDQSGEYPTIADAIDAAVSGDIIELGDGTFTGPGNRDITFQGKELTVRSLSGSPELCVIDAEAGPEAHHRIFTLESGEGPGTLIEGLTLQNAYVDGSSCGSAIQVRGGASPTIRDCIFRGNRSACGGAVWVQATTALLVDCVFEDNSASHHGGAVVLTNSASTISNCLFVGNASEQLGGALLTYFSTGPVIRNVTFSGNEAVAGGALFFENGSSHQVEGCTFSGNTAGPDGATIEAMDDVVVTLDSSLLVGAPQGSAVKCTAPATITISCTNIFGNVGGDWTDCAAGQEGSEGNFSMDPQFCSSDPDGDRHWWLQNDSPAADGNHPDGAGCEIIGAWGVNCGATPTILTTWGRLKHAYGR